VHAAICDVLMTHGKSATLAASTTPKISEACFANPVAADVMIDGQKIAGAALRRTRLGLLHQGSIQLGQVPSTFADELARALCACAEPLRFEAETNRRAAELTEQKYGTTEWLRRR
jgi:lipoate-protein ligase A